LAYLIPRAVARLLAVHPGVQVQLVESSTPAQLTALRRGRLEVAVVATGRGLPAYDLEGLDLTEVRGGRGAGVAVCDSHPFTGRTSVSVEDLVGQSWVVGANAAGSPEFGAWPDLQEPNIAFAVRGWPTRLGLVAAGLGIALVPGSMAPVLPRGVSWVPVRTADAVLGRTTFAVTTVEPRPAAAAVVHALVEEACSWGAAPAGS
jgi:DNA-binding transcriptional LysR family regulator